MRMLSGLLAAVLLVSWASLASAQPAWENVFSKEGKFSVEMPVKPSIQKTRTRKGPDGTVKVMILGCKTDNAIYLAYRMDLPIAIVKGSEEAELNAARDDLAQEWNGKVISEKKVRADLRIGRDFTVRGKPAEETGTTTIRVRQYLDGKTIYAVMVVSAPNRELPVDTGRFLGSLALGEGGVRAAGKPGPEPTGKNLPGWGLAIDPDKDCEFRPEDKTLTIEVPGKWHDLNPNTNKLNSPRVVWTVEGDFTITVKVAGDFKPGGTSTNPKGVPFNGGGIIVWNNTDNFIRLERGAMNRKGKLGTFILFEEREAGYGGAVNNEVYKGGPCYLRMERKGSRISGALSFDGDKWKKLLPIDTLWPAQLKVGLSAINSNSEPMAVRFEEFSLKGKILGGKTQKSDTE
jgi:regulation of enolase protein 1 (concanavalin A-like superfamily)